MKKVKNNLLHRVTVLIFTVLLAVGMVLNAVPVNVSAAPADIVSGDDWSLDADGRLTLKSNAGITNWYRFHNQSVNAGYREQVKTAVIENGATRISEYTFYKHTNMTSVIMPETLTDEIASCAFMSCTGLKTIILPSGLKTIGASAFSNCAALESVTLPSHLETIHNNAFYKCASLASITIPAEVKNIAYLAFDRCSSLANVTMLGNVPPQILNVYNSSWNIFNGCPCVAQGVKGIHVPAGTTAQGTTILHEYKNASDEWMNYKDNITDGQTYAVTVNNGTGSGRYAEDDKVTITANAPATEKVFDKWQVISGGAALENAASTTTTFTMPAKQTEVTATYRNLKDISYSLDGGNTWLECDELADVLFKSGFISCANPIVRLNRDVTINGVSPVLLVYNNNVLLDGNGHTIKRGACTTALLEMSAAGTLTLQNITIDGGAVWNNAENVQTRENSGISLAGNSHLIYCHNQQAKVVLGEGAVLQNNHLKNSDFNGAAVTIESGSLVMKSGSVIRNNTAVGNEGNVGGAGGAIHVDTGASFTMDGGKIYGNCASLAGGAIVNWGSLKLSGGEIYNNAAIYGGGVYYTKEQSSLSVAGNVKIHNNSNGNIYLTDGKTITVDADKPLADGAKIGVTTQKLPTDENSVSITGTNNADLTEYFISDNQKYTILNSNNNAVLLSVKKSTVIFNYNGATGGNSVTNKTAVYDYAYGELPTPVKTGYIFSGWYTEQSGGVRVDSGTKVTKTVDHTLYARWTKETYTITYNLNGGTATGENPTSYDVETDDFTLSNPSRVGYTFAGWSGTGLTGEANKNVTVRTGSTENRTYTAHWTAVNYNVILNGNSGSGTDLTSYTYATGATLPTDWVRKGYTFNGWYDNENFSGTAVTNISNTDIGNKEYWAKWTDDIAPVIGTLTYNYRPKNLWQWLIGKESLVITVPVTEEGSGAEKITYIVTADGGTAETKTENISNGKAVITVPADFKGTIVITCTDKALNKSNSVTVGAGLNASGIIIEDNAPEITFSVSGGAKIGEVYDIAPVISVTVEDAKNGAISAGIASITYQIGNGEVKTVNDDYTADMILNKRFTIPADEILQGEVVISVKVTDNAGNTAQEAFTVNILTDLQKTEIVNEAIGRVLDSISPDNDVTIEDIMNAINDAITETGVTGVSVSINDFEKTPATEDEEGNIAGEITITCGAVGDSVSINKTIARLPHTHNLTLVPAKEATCTQEGNTEYYVCEGCGKYFTDEEGTAETVLDSTKIAALGHDYDTSVWDYRAADGHAHKCKRCGQYDTVAAHIPGAAATAETPQTCTVCGWQIASFAETGPDNSNNSETVTNPTDSENTNGASNPKTGDNANAVIWIVLAGASLIGLLALIFVKKYYTAHSR